MRVRIPPDPDASIIDGTFNPCLDPREKSFCSGTFEVVSLKAKEPAGAVWFHFQAQDDATLPEDFEFMLETADTKLGGHTSDETEADAVLAGACDDETRQLCLSVGEIR